MKTIFSSIVLLFFLYLKKSRKKKYNKIYKSSFLDNFEYPNLFHKSIRKLI